MTIDIKTLPSYEGENRGYIGWSPGDDYMSGKGWSENRIYGSWDELGAEGWDIDLNLVGDFYFNGVSKQCPDCKHGYAPQAQAMDEDFYDFEGTGRKWHAKITDADFAALKEANRIFRDEFKSAEEMNAAVRNGGVMVHDAINRGVMIAARCEALGIPHLCPTCNGHAYLPTGEIALLIWMLYPRKGASCGITVKNIKEEELPAIKAWLRKSLDAHKAHFKWALDENEKE